MQYIYILKTVYEIIVKLDFNMLVYYLSSVITGNNWFMSQIYFFLVRSSCNSLFNMTIQSYDSFCITLFRKKSSDNTSNPLFISISQQNQKVLNKLRSRQKEVENLENEPSSAISLKHLQLNGGERNGRNYQKVFTWVPGRKVSLTYERNSP